MNPADALVELTRLVELHGASSATRAWLAEQRRVAAVLVFRPAGFDEADRPLYQVGTDKGRVVMVSPKNEGVAWWWRAVSSRPLGVALTGRSPEAARKLLSRGLDEIGEICPELGAELRRNGVARAGAAIYAPAVNSPKILV